jgi:hypothetical protein
MVAMAYLLYDSIMSPVRFDKTRIAREKAVIERITDIRSAQRGFKQVNGRYTGSFDTLINFVLTAEMEFERQLVSSDDSVGLAKLKKARKKNIEKFTVKVIDTVEPEAELVAKYEERYNQFKEIYPACKPLYEIIK